VLGVEVAAVSGARRRRLLACETLVRQERLRLAERRTIGLGLGPEVEHQRAEAPGRQLARQG
jgi:hypothetical protein